MANGNEPRAKTLVADAREAIEVCAGMNARLAARRIGRFLEARLRAVDFSLAQFGLMAQIAAASDDSIAVLAERLDLDQSTLSRNLRSLERAGLVEIAAVEKDLRKRAVWLTETGARRLEAAIPVWRAAHTALSEVVAPIDVWRLADASAALAEAEPRPRS